jgi:hypothetical protein
MIITSVIDFTLTIIDNINKHFLIKKVYFLFFFCFKLESFRLSMHWSVGRSVRPIFNSNSIEFFFISSFDCIAFQMNILDLN